MFKNGVNLNENGWYCKFLEFLWGGNIAKEYKNFCPLFWLIIGSIVISPIVLIIKGLIRFGNIKIGYMPCIFAWLRTRTSHLLPASRDLAAAELEQFQFGTLRVSNHTACRFAKKTCFFRSLLAGRRCAAASRFHLFQR